MPKDDHVDFFLKYSLSQSGLNVLSRKEVKTFYFLSALAVSCSWIIIAALPSEKLSSSNPPPHIMMVRVNWNENQAIRLEAKNEMRSSRLLFFY